MPSKKPYAVRGTQDRSLVVHASALIAKAKLKQAALPMPSEDALAELKQLLDHNDSSTHRERVSAPDAIAMLKGMGWRGRERGALDTVCRMAFGRKSYGTP